MKTKTFYFKVHGKFNGVESDTEEDITIKLYDALTDARFDFKIDKVDEEMD